MNFRARNICTMLLLPLALLILSSSAALSVPLNPPSPPPSSPTPPHGLPAPRLNVKVWKGSSTIERTFPYPETKMPNFIKSNAAIAFSGGGTRAMSSAIGVLRAMNKLGLLEQFGYITGVSGGALACMMFSLYNTSFPLSPQSDSEMLGSIVDPSMLTRIVLMQQCQRCALKVASTNLWGNLVNIGMDSQIPLIHLWTTAIGRQFLEPFGINPRALWTHDETTKADIIARNPALASYPPGFITQHANHPFLIIGATLVGPTALAPLSLTHRSYTQFSVNSLYCGAAWNRNVTYFGGGILQFDGTFQPTIPFSEIPETMYSAGARAELMKELSAMAVLPSQMADVEREEEEIDREEREGKIPHREMGVVTAEEESVLRAKQTEKRALVQRGHNAKESSSSAVSLEQRKKIVADKKKDILKKKKSDETKKKIINNDNNVSPPPSSPDDLTRRLRSIEGYVGGLIETFGFGADPPYEMLPSDVTAGNISVVATHPFFSVADLASATSWAPSALFAEIPVMDKLVSDIENYWSPSLAFQDKTPPSPSNDEPYPIIPSRPYFLGDGGDEENVHAISLVKRGVTNLFMIWSVDVPLRPRSKFDPYGQKITSDDIDDCFAA